MGAHGSNIMSFQISHLEAFGDLDAGWAAWSIFSAFYSLQLFRRTLLRCFSVKLQKCFEDYKTSPGTPSAWGWVDNNWIIISGWTYPLRCRHRSHNPTIIMYITATFTWELCLITCWGCSWCHSLAFLKACGKQILNGLVMFMLC